MEQCWLALWSEHQYDDSMSLRLPSVKMRYACAALFATLAALLSIAVEAAKAMTSDGDAASCPASAIDGTRRLFAYMDTRNEAGTKRRTHVFALTTAGTLAERVTSQIDSWREPPSGEGGRLRYNDTLEFVSLDVRISRVELLYNHIVEYNQLVTAFFAKEGKAVLPDFLIVMSEKFGPLYEENILHRPTQNELNAIHEQFAVLQGTGDKNVSPKWGDWLKILKHADMIIQENADSIEDSNHGGNDEVEKALLLHRIYGLLEVINEAIHAIEAVTPWHIQHRVSFNKLHLNDVQPLPLMDEDFEPDRWRLALEMGGLYLAYAVTGKNILHIMYNNDLGAFENNEENNKVRFQADFNSKLYAYWTLFNETEVEKRGQFEEWWKKNDITGKYGYEWDKRDQPNGYIRFGQQICDPASDCERPWIDLLDEFAETPFVDDIRFSDVRPYGVTDEDLHFLYQGDESIH